jgi:hypothetical protein
VPRTSPTPRKRRRSTRPGKAAPLDQLAARLEGLEQRLLRLEAGRAAPGDGRAATVRAKRPVPRCPGCGLPLRSRAGRCLACKRPVDSI